VGIDLGVTHFAALSNGEFIDHPRFFREAEKKVAKAQQTLSRKKTRKSSAQESGPSGSEMSPQGCQPEARLSAQSLTYAGQSVSTPRV
jgi:hypothetical protein